MSPVCRIGNGFSPAAALPRCIEKCASMRRQRRGAQNTRSCQYLDDDDDDDDDDDYEVDDDDEDDDEDDDDVSHDDNDVRDVKKS